MFISSFFVFFGKSEICWSLICFAYSFSITYYILSSKISNINQKKRTISTKHSGPIFCFKKFFKLFREFSKCLVIHRTAFFSCHIPWPNFFTQCITKLSIISKADLHTDGVASCQRGIMICAIPAVLGALETQAFIGSLLHQ